MKRYVLGTKSFHLQYDAFQFGNETKNVPFQKRQLVAFTEMKRCVLGTKGFHLQNDAFQFGNETNVFENKI